MRENRDIKGITVNGTEIKLSQYANDTAFILDGSNRRLNNSKKDRSTLDKSKLWKYWSIFFPERNFKWIKHKGESSGGVVLSTSWERMNFKRNVLSFWEYRRLTLLGKITILKSFVARQLLYVLSSLQTSRTVMKEVNKLFFLFFWNSKGDKIKRDIIINHYLHRGIVPIGILV